MKWSNEHKIMMARWLQSKGLVLLQVIGFSALAKILHEFSYHFSPIRDWFLAGCGESGVFLKQAEPAPDIAEGRETRIAQITAKETDLLIRKSRNQESKIRIGFLTGLSELTGLRRVLPDVQFFRTCTGVEGIGLFR